MPHSEDALSNDKDDVRRLARKIMNKAASKRLISKQEACVLLGGLDLTLCTESIESVSISNSKRLRVSGESTTDSDKILALYEKRPVDQEPMSLHTFYDWYKNKREGRKIGDKYYIPNFVGVKGSPVYPVTNDYAKHVLICYNPWTVYPNESNWIQKFELFINNPNKCPRIALLPYQRVMLRHYNGSKHVDPKATTGDHWQNPIHVDDLDYMRTYNMHGISKSSHEYDTEILKNIHRGRDFKWVMPPKVCL